ncbi:MAG: lytic transglycosylase domain-containing protein [Marmoricola sp.]
MTDASHRAKPITRRTKALTLVPMTIASCVATATVLTTTGATASLPVVAKPLPGGGHVPIQAIQSQATPLTPKGKVAPAVPKNAVDAVVASSYTSGIPAVALNAYQRAAEVINASDPTCNMPWQLVGAIGRVESDHGQFGGSALNAKGEAVPAIYGPVLDGTNGVGLIRDTDGGVLDHNTTYDRAVGPMQFLPSTWNVVGVDANGDGTRDPQNIYDASLATAVYLCSGRSDLSKTADQRSAVFRYNHSTDYVNLVLAIMKAYEVGNYSSIPAGSYGAAAEPSKAALPKPKKAKPTSVTVTATAPSSPSSSSSSGGSGGGGSAPSSSPTPSSTSNPVQDFLNQLGGKSTTPTPGASMSPSAATTWCNAKLSNVLDLFGTYHTECVRKVTGMTPAQADSAWAAHQSNLAAWLAS